MNKKIIIGVVAIFIGIVGFKILSREKNIGLEARQPSSEAEIAAQKLHMQAIQLRKDRKMLEAQEAYQKILKEYPESRNIDQIQKEFEKLNLDIILSSAPVEGRSVTHEVQVGDTLGKIARKYGVTVELIKNSNNLKSDVIRVGQKLRIWQGSLNVLVDKSRNILILKDGNELVKIYLVSTGENNSTPVGTFTIVNKLVDPVWFNKGVVVSPESPENVLGTRWLGFDLPGYGIHGTIEPETIGKQVTAGCVRMRNEEVEELYGLLPIGTKVVVVD